MSGLWIPGMTSGAQDDFVDRVRREIERYASDVGVERAFVELELVDGARFALDSISPEPGFGFVTIVPHPALEEDLPERLIVPVGSIRRIELMRAEEQRGRFGFSVASG